MLLALLLKYYASTVNNAECKLIKLKNSMPQICEVCNKYVLNGWKKAFLGVFKHRSITKRLYPSTYKFF